jgi:hypothetical protein
MLTDGFSSSQIGHSSSEIQVRQFYTASLIILIEDRSTQFKGKCQSIGYRADNRAVCLARWNNCTAPKTELGYQVIAPKQNSYAASYSVRFNLNVIDK